MRRQLLEFNETLLNGDAKSRSASGGTGADAWRERIVTREPHEKQRQFINSPAKRKVIRAGRRGGKTVGIAILALKLFAEGRRVLYAAPTQEQIDAFWFELCLGLDEFSKHGALYKNATMHLFEVSGTKNRVRAKTAWNADTLRGDYADVLILDEFQLMHENTWDQAGAPMLMDNNGDAVFIYTPLSARTRTQSKADDPRHAAKLYKKHDNDTSGRWETFHFTSYENPYISAEGIEEVAADITAVSRKQELLAEDDIEIPGALWNQAQIDALRFEARLPGLKRVVVAIDPAVTATVNSDNTGIIVAGVGEDGHGYVLQDATVSASPDTWANKAVECYRSWEADRIVAEVNNGGDLVEHTVRTVDANVSLTQVRASRGKVTRAEPIAALYEQGKVHHVGVFNELESEMCFTLNGVKSPDRVDALVWALTELMLPSGRFDRSDVW